MDNDEFERQLLRSRRRRWPWVVLAVVLLLAAALGVMRYTLHHRVQKKLASLRAAGYPTTPAELDAWYPTPTGSNAADIYQLAFDAYVKDEELESLLPGFSREVDFPAPGEPLPDGMVEAMEAYLEKNARALALLAEAAAIPECRYPVALTWGLMPPLPHLAKLRVGAHLLSLQASVQAHRGENDLAIESISVMIAMGNSLSDEPVLMSHMVRVGLRHRARETAVCILRRTQLTDSQLASLSQLFERTIDRPAFGHTLAGERAAVLGAIETIVGTSRGAALFNAITGIGDADRLGYLRVMDQLMKQAEDPLGQAVDINAMIEDVPSYCMATRTMGPAMRASLLTERQSDAATQTLLVGLAAKRYQLAHDTLPERLDLLVPDYLDAVPADPFDGKPLRYKLTDTGVIVYSVGKDGVDNGGKELDVRGQRFQAGTDIVFIIPR